MLRNHLPADLYNQYQSFKVVFILLFYFLKHSSSFFLFLVEY